MLALLNFCVFMFDSSEIWVPVNDISSFIIFILITWLLI